MSQQEDTTDQEPIQTESTSVTSSNEGGTEIISLSKEKYDLLIKEFQKIKSQNSLLKKAVLAEQKKTQQLQTQISLRDQTIREKVEENDVLSFNNKRLEKRLAQLMFDLADKSKNQKSESFLSFFAKGFNQGDEELAGVKKELEIIKEELEAKISENEHVHIQIFELKKNHELSISKFKESIAELNAGLQQRDRQLEKVAKEVEEYQKKVLAERESLSDKINKLRDDLKLKEENEQEVREFAMTLQKELNEMKNFISRKVPFDDTKQEILNVLNLPPHNKKMMARRIDVFERGLAIFKQLSKGLSALYASASEKVQLLSKTKSHSQVVKYLASKFINAAKPEASMTSLHSKLSAQLLKECEQGLQNVREKLALHQQYYASNSEAKQSNTNSTLSNSNSVIDASYAEYRKQLAALFKSFQDYLEFHKEALLYVVACVQDSHCALSSNELATSLTDYIAEDAKSKESGDSVQKFQDVYMNNTKLTLIYSTLVQFVNKYILYIEAYGLGDPAKVLQFRNMYITPVKEPQSPKPEKQKLGRVFTEHEEFFSTAVIYSASLPVSSEFSIANQRSRSSSDPAKLEKKTPAPKKKPEEPPVAPLEVKKHEQDILEGIFAAMKQLTDQLAQSATQEHGAVFVSPSMKAVNEKVNQALSVSVNLLRKLIEVAREVQTVDTLINSLEVRGTYCNYEHQSEKSYYKQSNVGTNSMEKRARSFMKAMNTKFQADAQSPDNITQQEAIDNKKEVAQLKQTVNTLKNDIQQHKTDIKYLQEQIASVNEVIDIFERKLMEAYLHLQTSMQHRTNLDLDSLDRSIQEPSNQTETMPQVGNSLLAKFSIETKKDLFLANLDKFDQLVQKAISSLSDMIGAPSASLIKMSSTQDNTLVQQQQAEQSASSTEEEPVSEQPTETEEEVVVDPLGASTPAEAPEKLEVPRRRESLSARQMEILTVLQKPAAVDTTIVTPTATQTPAEMPSSPPETAIEVVKAENVSIRARQPTAQELELFSSNSVNRERLLQQKFQRQIQYLLLQLESCDKKAIEFKLAWQRAILELEQACERERQLNLQLSQTRDILDTTQDDLKTTKHNYENQIQVLSDALTSLQLQLSNSSSARRASPEDQQQTPAQALIGFASSYFKGNSNR